jgi:hypothetical protein
VTIEPKSEENEEVNKEPKPEPAAEAYERSVFLCLEEKFTTIPYDGGPITDPRQRLCPLTLNFSHEILSLFQHEKVRRPSIFHNSTHPSMCRNIGKIARENPTTSSRFDITELITI